MALIVTKQAPVPVAERWESYDDDTQVLLRGLDNDEYRVGLDRAKRRLAARDARFGEHEIGVLPGEETEHTIQCKLLGQFVVRDWKGVCDESGNNVPYDPDTAAGLLRSDIEFFVWVIRMAGEIAAEAHKEREEQLGKSSRSTAGTKSGATRRRSSSKSPDA